MDNLQNLINYGAEAIREIFDRHGLEEVPVTEKNLSNAITVLPEVKKEVAAAFEGFDGYDNAGGKLKAKIKKIKVDPKKLTTALGIAAAVVGAGAAMKGKAEETEEAKPVKKEAPTVFGFNAYLFWSVVVIIILIIVLVAVKAMRK